MIRFVLTDGSDPDFAALCAELDAQLNELAGGEKTARPTSRSTARTTSAPSCWPMTENSPPAAAG